MNVLAAAIVVESVTSDMQCVGRVRREDHGRSPPRRLGGDGLDRRVGATGGERDGYRRRDRKESIYLHARPTALAERKSLHVRVRSTRPNFPNSHSRHSSKIS